MDFSLLQQTTTVGSAAPQTTAAHRFGSFTGSQSNSLQPAAPTDLSLAALAEEPFFIMAAVYQRQMNAAVPSLSSIQKAGIMLVEITNGPLSYDSRVGMKPNISTWAQTSVSIGQSTADPTKRALCRVPVNFRNSFQFDEQNPLRLSDQDALIRASRLRYAAPIHNELPINPMTDPHALVFPELGPHWWHTPNDWYSMFVVPALAPANVNQYMVIAYPTQPVTAPPVLAPGVFRVTSALKSFYYAGYGIRNVPEDFVLDLEAIPTVADTMHYIARYRGSNKIIDFPMKLSRVLLNRLLLNEGWRLAEKTPQLEVWERKAVTHTADRFMAVAAPSARVGDAGLGEVDEEVDHA